MIGFSFLRDCTGTWVENRLEEGMIHLSRPIVKQLFSSRWNIILMASIKVAAVLISHSFSEIGIVISFWQGRKLGSKYFRNLKISQLISARIGI